MPSVCNIPNCITKKSSFKEKRSTFKVPKDVDLRRKWEANIPGNKILRSSARVCEFHFLESEIIRESVKHDITGRLIYHAILPFPRLRKTAIPTIFNDSRNKSSSKHLRQNGQPLRAVSSTMKNEPDEALVETPALIKSNLTLKKELPVLEEVATNSLFLEANVKTEIEDTIEESDTYYADDPLRLVNEEALLRRDPGDEVREFHNYAFMRGKEANKIKTEKYLEIEELQSKNLKDKSQIGDKSLIRDGDNMSDAESPSDFRGFERIKQTYLPEVSRRIQTDKRSKLELKKALFISECHTEELKTRFYRLQKHHKHLLDQFEQIKKVVRNLQARKTISRDAADKLWKVIPNSLKF